MPGANVRIPLQLGNSAVLGRLRASALFLPSLVFVFAWIAIPGWIGAQFEDETLAEVAGILGFVPGLVVAVLAIVSMAFASEGADDARRQAPSDLELSAAGVRVHGGPHDGVSLKWDELTDAVVEKNAESEAGAMLRFFAAILRLLRLSAVARRVNADPYELRVGKRVLGIAVREDEVESLRLLAQTLVALGKLRTTPADQLAPAPTAPDVISCASCGGAAPPADADTVSCRFCGSAVAMPQALRERIRAHDQVKGGARLERTIRRLLDQPGASVAGRWLSIGSFAMRLGWPLASLALGTLVVVHALEQDQWPRIVLVDPAPFPIVRDLALASALAAICFFGVAIALDAYFANRRALRLLTFDFGATPPSRPGEGWGCRVCAAPLPAGDRILARCAYCSAENVLGIDLRMQGARTQAQASSVGDALRHRRRARIRLAVVLVLLVAAAGLLARELELTVYAARPRPEPDYYSDFMCKRVRIDNHDDIRHWLTVTSEQGDRTRVVPAHGSVDLECAYTCVLHLAAGSYEVNRDGMLEIASGRLIPVEQPRSH
jgi:hypothetical protein